MSKALNDLVPAETTSDWHENSQTRCSGDDWPCVICGRGIKNAETKSRWLHLVDGGMHFLRPGVDWDDDASDLGSHPIGADCLKKRPWLRPFVTPPFED